MDDNYLDIPPEEMDREKTLELITDVEQWNEYREKYPQWFADLSGANLEWFDLQKINLMYVNLQEAELKFANLEKANLMAANLHKVTLTKAHLKEADLKGSLLEEANCVGACMENADLLFSNLQGADLSRANLEGACLDQSNFKESCLESTKLQGATLRKSNLTKANLQLADFQGADIRWVNFREANLSGANLSVKDIRYADLRGADLRSAKNVRFDQCLIEGTLLSPNSKEPWTVLRREYTGSKLLFHLLLLIAFLIPLVTKTFLWNAVSQGEAFINNPTINELPERFVVSLLVGMPGDLKGWLSIQSLWFVVNIIIIAYNAARILLTVNVGHMHEELESTGTSPKYHEDFPWLKGWANIKKSFSFITKSESIDWLLWIHKKAQWLLLIGAGLAALNIIRWLFTTVHAPL